MKMRLHKNNLEKEAINFEDTFQVSYRVKQ